MLLSVDRPSPGAAAAATAVVGEAEELALSAGVVVVVVIGGGPDDTPAAVVLVPLAGEGSSVRVKDATCVDVAETLGRLQVVVAEDEVQSAADWATASGRGLVFCANAVVVAPRAARMWEARIGGG